MNEYNILLDEIYRGLMENIPHVLAILLKLLNNSIKKFLPLRKIIIIHYIHH